MNQPLPVYSCPKVENGVLATMMYIKLVELYVEGLYMATQLMIDADGCSVSHTKSTLTVSHHETIYPYALPYCTGKIPNQAPPSFEAETSRSRDP